MTALLYVSDARTFQHQKFCQPLQQHTPSQNLVMILSRRAVFALTALIATTRCSNAFTSSNLFGTPKISSSIIETPSTLYGKKKKGGGGGGGYNKKKGQPPQEKQSVKDARFDAATYVSWCIGCLKGHN